MEEEPLHVLTADGTPAVWHVEYACSERDVDDPWRLSLIAAGGERYDVAGRDLFHCLIEIRRQTDRAGILLCCHGAGRNARTSGFLSGSIGAIGVYREHRWRGPLPGDLVGIFDYAPPRTIATVEEQEAHGQKVDRYRRSPLALLNPFVWITFAYCQLYEWVRGAQFRRLAADKAFDKDAGR